MKLILQGGAEQTAGAFRNITRTTAGTATKQFERVIDKAWLKVQSGAVSQTAAIKQAVAELARDGIETMIYPSGHTDHIDVAVRRAAVTGTNQTAMRLQLAAAEETGTDLVEVSAHAGARNYGTGPQNHASWQGKVYRISGASAKYPSLEEATGYGTGAGLGGWNCRHTFFPFLRGLSEPTHDAQGLAELDAPKYNYNGQDMNEYEATQRQREIERHIRRWKREQIGMEAAGLPTAEADMRNKRMGGRATQLHQADRAQEAIRPRGHNGRSVSADAGTGTGTETKQSQHADVTRETAKKR